MVTLKSGFWRVYTIHSITSALYTGSRHLFILNFHRIECFVFLPVLLQAEQQGPAYLTTGQFAPHALGRRDRPEAVHNARHQAYDMRMQSREQHNKVFVGGAFYVFDSSSACCSGCPFHPSHYRVVPKTRFLKMFLTVLCRLLKM